MKEYVISLIYKFYPKDISYFNDAYISTPEYFNLRSTIEKDAPRWPNLLSELSLKFKSEYVRDITHGEPSNRCAIYIFKQEFIYEIVIHLSKLADYYSFYSKKIFVDKINLYTEELEKVVNSSFPEIESEMEFILKSIQLHYQYSLMPQHISDILIPNISTKDKDLGEATIFDALFADSDL